MTKVFLALVAIYRMIGSPIFGGACRFEPSCSEYAAQVLKTQSPGKAVKLIVIRLMKCRPGGAFGFDPAPEQQCRGHHESRK